jgi:tripartite-type tricarboxylate transporter receptor subunit TctC
MSAVARMAKCSLGLMFVLATMSTSSVAQESPEKFYTGKVVHMIVGYSAGSAFEVYARILIRYMPAHIPGNPTVIIQNMPGAGSLNATAWLANVAPRDGSVFGIINPVNTTQPLLEPARAKFDPLKFSWIGSMNRESSSCGFWNGKINNLADMQTKDIIVGSTGPISGSAVDAKTVASTLGYHLRVVLGYQQLKEVRLAATRGEVDGYCGLLISSLKAEVWDDYKSGKVKIPLQMGLQRHPDLPDVPNIFELVKTDEDRSLLRFVFGPWSYGRPIVAPPDVPQDRLTALRTAFQDTMKDPEFLAEAKRIRLEVQPMSWDHIAPLINDIYKTAPAVIARARQIFSVGTR